MAIERPLGHLRVVELPGLAPLLCGKHFADLGAEVVKVEPLGGDPARRKPPVVRGSPGEEVSATWLSYTIGKQGLEIDFESAAGRTRLRQIVAAADVVIHEFPPSQAARLGLDYATLTAAHPGLIVISITPFGASGPYSEWRGSDLVQCAMSGYMYMTGPPDGRPLHPSAPIQSHLHAGNHAFVAALTALRTRQATGSGAFIDQSIRDTGAWMLTHTYQHWDMQRVNLKRQGTNRDMGAKRRLRSVLKSADGYAVWMFTTGHIGARSLRALVAWMESEGQAPEWLRRIDWETTDLLGSSPNLAEDLERAFTGFYAGKTGTELLDFALRSGFMMAPANTLRDVATDPQLAARDAWRIRELPGLGPVRVPGPPVQATSFTWEPRTEPATALPAGESPNEERPAPGLAGVRVLDFGTTLAAPTVARHLADLGADVIKIESHAHPDTLRVGTPYANETGGLDRSGYFGAYNAGKRSFALNLQREGALDVVRRLVERSDVVLENYAPGVMTRLGLTYEQLREWNPRIILASHSLQGQTGPRSPHRGYGQIASGMTGWYDLTGEEGGEPLGPYSAYTDFLSWPYLFHAILVALDVRDRTGEGCRIDHAQVESSLHFLAPLLLELEVTGHARTRCGNREDDAAPNNTYPCAGEDRWIAISVTNDQEWQQLCRVLGSDSLLGDARFASHAARKANEPALDLAIDTLTAEWDAFELTARLQQAGIAAGPVAKAEDLFNDPQLAHRQFWKRLSHDVLGEHAVITHSFRISGMDAGPHRAAPRLGEHTFEIASDLLEMGGDEIADLVAQGVLE